MNFMPRPMFSKLGKCGSNLRPYNMVLSNYERKTSSILGVIQVELAIGTSTKLTLSMVIKSKEKFNLLLGREWVHGIGTIPSILHQRISIRRKDGVVENIEVDQSYYKAYETKDGNKSFDQQLAKVAPCVDEVHTPDENPSSFLSLDPDHGFLWDTEKAVMPKESNPPTG